MASAELQVSDVGGIAESKGLAAADGQAPEVQPAQAAALAEKPSSGGGMYRSFRNFSSKWQPTNYSMLLFRTLNRDLCRPNCNDDYIAPLFRDKLMPVRGWLNRSFGGLLEVYRAGVEDPEYGLPGVVNFVDARTKWFDSAVKQALDGGFRQVVAIAAGFDTRAYRFHRPGVTFFEVDLPAASKRKRGLVKSCLPPDHVLPRPVYVGADLSNVPLAQALGRTAFDPGRKTLFTCEGLIYYLPDEAVQALLLSIAELSAPGSRLYFDFLDAEALARRRFFPGYDACAEVCALKKEPFVSGIEASGPGVSAVLAGAGYELARLWGPREMLAAQLPHEVWDEELPPILTFYGYAEARSKDADARPAE